MELKKYIGVDIGGTNTTVGLVTEEGKIIHSEWYETKGFPNFEALRDKVIQFIKDSNEEITGIGIGAPAGNFRLGIINNSANLPWKGIIKVTEIFKAKIKIPVAVANDANAAALGEQVFGISKGKQNFAVVTIGTGVGSGIVLNGTLVEGFDGNGGEFGHIITVPNGRQCGCGRKGCLETYASAGGIVKTAQELFSNNLSLDIQTAKSIYELAKNGNEEANLTFQKTGEILGLAIANMVTLLGLEQVVLFGGPLQAGDLLLNPVRKSFHENVLHYYKDVPIEISSLPLRDAAILGAASLVANVK